MYERKKVRMKAVMMLGNLSKRKKFRRFCVVVKAANRERSGTIKNIPCNTFVIIPLVISVALII